jgi:hypothetical protein
MVGPALFKVPSGREVQPFYVAHFGKAIFVAEVDKQPRD